MKQKFKKITAATAALVLTCGCVVSGLYRPSTVSFAEGGNAKYTGTVDENSKVVFYAGKSANYTVMSSIKSDDRPDTFVVPSVCMYGEPVSNYEKGDQRLRNIFALGYKSVDLTGSENVIVSDGIYELQDVAFKNTDDLKTVTLSDTVTVIGDLELDKDTVFRGHRGAFAERYAVSAGYTYEYTGDISGDGKIDAADILTMSQYFDGAGELKEDEAARADENFDAKLNVADFVLLKNEIIEPRVSAFGASFAGALASPDLKNIRSISDKIDAEGYMKFAAASAKNVLVDTVDSKGEENPVYSPLSYYMALSIAAECANGNTRDEIVKALGAEDIESVRKENDVLFRSINFDDFQAYCLLANSLWLNDKWEFKQDTLDLIAKDYYAVSFAKDFRNNTKQTEKEISEWICTNTSGKIKPEIKIEDPESEIMKIINTVSFKETWDEEFSETKTSAFHKPDGEDEDCKFMEKRENGKVGFADNFMFYAEDLRDGYKMNFVLPDEGTDIKNIISDSETLAGIYAGELDFANCSVTLTVPEFEVASKFDLIDATKQMGVSDAFDGLKADFNAVVDYDKNGIPGAKVSMIDHEARIRVDEKGCEGAAYTVVAIVTTCPAPPDKRVEFTLDRPFFYYVTDKNNIPVFAGIVDNPNESPE